MSETNGNNSQTHWTSMLILKSQFTKLSNSCWWTYFNSRVLFSHLSQSPDRKIHNLGLCKWYKKDENFNLRLVMIDGLAFFPVDKVREGIVVIFFSDELFFKKIVQLEQKTYYSILIKIILEVHILGNLEKQTIWF